MEKLNADYKEAVKEVTSFIERHIKENRVREDNLISNLIPHLRKKTINTIIDKEKKHYTYHKLKMPSDNYLLNKHLGELISDFDCNIYKLTSKEMPSFAKIINKNPSVYFFDYLD